MVVSDCRSCQSFQGLAESEGGPLVLAPRPAGESGMATWIAAGVAAGVITWAITSLLAKAFR